MPRIDQRQDTELRPVKITRNFNKYAEGSCLIEFGNTKVICTASIEEQKPLFLKEVKSGWITAEYGMLPRSCASRIPREGTKGKVNGRTHEIQRLIGRSLRGVVDVTMIGERTVWIDCDVIQGDGGTRTASITGSFIALIDALRILKKKGIITQIPVQEFVAAISCGIVEGRPMLDLCYQEDSSAEVDMNIVMTESGKLIEIQGTAEGKPFTYAQMQQLLELSRCGIAQLIQLQKEALGPL